MTHKDVMALKAIWRNTEPMSKSRLQSIFDNPNGARAKRAQQQKMIEKVLSELLLLQQGLVRINVQAQGYRFDLHAKERLELFYLFLP